MSFDGISLLLPQSNVATIEVANSVVKDDAIDSAGTAGKLNSGGREWPVFALTSDFSKKTEFPSHYKFCVAMHDADQNAAFAIACEQVSTVNIEDTGQLSQVQPCMKSGDCPIDALMLRDNQMLLVSNIDSMQQFLIPEVTEA